MTVGSEPRITGSVIGSANENSEVLPFASVAVATKNWLVSRAGAGITIDLFVWAWPAV